MSPRRPALPRPTRMVAPVSAILLAGFALGACTSAPSVPPATGQVVATDSSAAAGSDGPVLPVTENPIAATSAVQALAIDSILVENNVGADGKATDDHLEVALTNTGPSDLTGIEVFYTFTDPATKQTENYYAALPDSFAIPAGGSRVANFDNTGAVDHFPVNTFSLYYTDQNALDVSVTVAAQDAASVTSTVTKDAGGPESAD